MEKYPKGLVLSSDSLRMKLLFWSTMKNEHRVSVVAGLMYPLADSVSSYRTGVVTL